MAKFTVKDTEITVVKIKDEDYLCLTDMLKAKDGDFFITDWLRNRNTLEYIGIWEQVYNPRPEDPGISPSRSYPGPLQQQDRQKDE